MWQPLFGTYINSIVQTSTFKWGWFTFFSWDISVSNQSKSSAQVWMDQQKSVDRNEMKKVATYFVIQNTVHNGRWCIKERLKNTSLVKWAKLSFSMRRPSAWCIIGAWWNFSWNIDILVNQLRGLLREYTTEEGLNMTWCTFYLSHLIVKC